LCLAMLTPTCPVRAGESAEVGDATRSAARKLGVEGVQAYEAGKYDVAMDRLERAFKVLAVPSLGLWSARALEKNGRLVEAAERFLKTTRLSLDSSGDRAVQEQAKKDAAREHEALLPRIPNLLVQIEGASPDDVEVTVNGVGINSALLGTAFPANPGRTVVVATGGGSRVEREATLVEGQTATVVLDFTGATPAGGQALPSDDTSQDARAASAGAAVPDDRAKGGRGIRPVLGWTAIGLGAGGIATGIITGLMATDQFNAAGCAPSGACRPGTSQGELDSINTLRTVTTAAFIAGGVLAASGITLLLIPPKKASSAYVTPYIGTTTFGLRGAF